MSKISKERTDFYFIVILVVIASNSFELPYDFSIVPMSIVFVLFIIFLGNDKMKQLTFWQKLGVSIIHAIVIPLTIAFLNVISTFLLQHITINWMKVIVEIIFLFFTLLIVFNILNNLSSKFIDGKFATFNRSE